MVTDSTIAKRLEKLIQANHSLANIDSLDALIPELIRLARDVTFSEAASFITYDPITNKLNFLSVKDEVVGNNAENILKGAFELEMGEGIAGCVAQSREPIIIRDAKDDKRVCRKGDQLTGFKTRNLLCVPVLHRDRLLGVIEVLNAKSKPFFDEADQMILMSFANLAAIALIRARLLESRLEDQKIKIQLETAAKIQSLFKPKIPDFGYGSHVWAITIQSQIVGGDLYDIIPLEDESYLIYVADVSGKGLPASLIMTSLWSKIRSEITIEKDLKHLLKNINATLYDLLSDEGYFVTIFILRYWPKTGDMTIASSGHLPAIWKKTDQISNFPIDGGVPLGVLPDSDFPAERIRLAPGESFIIVTDGATEAENMKGDLIGMDRLMGLINDEKAPHGEALISGIRSWCIHEQSCDDLTVLEIWRD